MSANLRVGFYCLISVLFSACATGRDLRGLDLHEGAPLKVAVMESPMSVDAARLQPVLAPPAKPGSTAAVERIARGKAHAQEFALTSMKAALQKRTGFEVVDSPAQADALLRFRITDYGLTPKAWRTGYITFEVVSTLALAGLIAYHGTAAAKAAAGAYLMQETVEETAEYYAGLGALDVGWRPVRMEAKLERLNPPATVWEGSATGLSDTKLSRILGKVSSAERAVQLDQATRHAVSDLVSEFSVAPGG